MSILETSLRVEIVSRRLNERFSSFTLSEELR
jgi:hypothetical protein